MKSNNKRSNSNNNNNNRNNKIIITTKIRLKKRKNNLKAIIQTKMSYKIKFLNKFRKKKYQKESKIKTKFGYVNFAVNIIRLTLNQKKFLLQKIAFIQCKVNNNKKRKYNKEIITIIKYKVAQYFVLMYQDL